MECMMESQERLMCSLISSWLLRVFFPDFSGVFKSLSPPLTKNALAKHLCQSVLSYLAADTILTEKGKKGEGEGPCLTFVVASCGWKEFQNLIMTCLSFLFVFKDHTAR